MNIHMYIYTYTYIYTRHHIYVIPPYDPARVSPPWPQRPPCAVVRLWRNKLARETRLARRFLCCVALLARGPKHLRKECRGLIIYIYRSIYLSICLSVGRSIYVSIHLTINTSSYLAFYIYISRPIYLWSICLSLFMYIYWVDTGNEIGASLFMLRVTVSAGPEAPAK